VDPASATRHTFASHWVLGGGSIEKLSKILGHYSIVQTEVYAHLRPNLFTPEDLAGLPISLRDGPNSVQEPTEIHNEIAK
jgi:integrase